MEVEIGTERRQIGEVASQFNRPFPVSCLCSVDIALPAVAVSSCKRNPIGSGNRRQMAMPSGSNLTIRWVDLDLLLCKYFLSSTCYEQIPVLLKVAKPDRKRESMVGGDTSGSSLTIRKLTSSLLFEFYKHFSSTSHRSRVVGAF
jgi:hypothetical protein